MRAGIISCIVLTPVDLQASETQVFSKLSEGINISTNNDRRMSYGQYKWLFRDVKNDTDGQSFRGKT